MIYLYSGKVVRVSPGDTDFSWNVLTLDGDNCVAGKQKCCCFQSCSFYGKL